MMKILVLSQQAIDAVRRRVVGRRSISKGVELAGRGHGSPFGAIKLAFADHVHGLDAGEDNARAAV